MKRYAIITKEFAFEAAHHLPNHRGKCRRPHGHSYRLQISLRGSINEVAGESSEGMVMDFDDLKRIVSITILEQIAAEEVSGSKGKQPIAKGGLDHNDLNILTGIRTTAENLVHWIWNALVAGGVPDTLLYRIRLWETEKGFVEITHAEREENEEL